ncbi:MAG: hypothetical protein GY947_15380 [Rhodobacteraceae bacterium]|nr:hypothetical protein [Paracoccaceae bacterium]
MAEAHMSIDNIFSDLGYDIVIISILLPLVLLILKPNSIFLKVVAALVFLQIALLADTLFVSPPYRGDGIGGHLGERIFGQILRAGMYLGTLILIIGLIAYFLSGSTQKQSRHAEKHNLVSWVLVALFLPAIAVGYFANFAWGHSAAVRDSASELAKEMPYCVWLSVQKRPVSSSGDISFLNFDKQFREHRHDTYFRGYHAVLFVASPDAVKTYHWSYREKQFVGPHSDSDWFPVPSKPEACELIKYFLDGM